MLQIFTSPLPALGVGGVLAQEDWSTFLDAVSWELAGSPVVVDATSRGDTRAVVARGLLHALSYDERGDVIEVAVRVPTPGRISVVRHLISRPSGVASDSAKGAAPEPGAHRGRRRCADPRPPPAFSGVLGVSCTRTRASTAITPPGDATSGLRSSSAISGCASASADTRRRTSPTAASAAPACEMRRATTGDLASASTSGAASGARRTSTSRTTSTSEPPAPQATTAPKSGSWTTPTSSSAPGDAIGCTSTPVGSWPACRAAASTSPAARRAAATLRRSVLTAPTAPLWTRSGATAFTATGNPRLAAARPAAAGVAATCCARVAIP